MNNSKHRIVTQAFWWVDSSMAMNQFNSEACGTSIAMLKWIEDSYWDRWKCSVPIFSIPLMTSVVPTCASKLQCHFHYFHTWNYVIDYLLRGYPARVIQKALSIFDLLLILSISPDLYIIIIILKIHIINIIIIIMIIIITIIIIMYTFPFHVPN